MTQQYGGGLTPQQQKAFSSWWLNEKYGGDLNNVEGLYQNETTGAWQADPNQIFDINPETGQKGQFKYMATPSYVGWIDVTPPKYINVLDEDGNVIGQQEMIRNRHGLYSTDDFLNDDWQRSRKVFDQNPNTGEAGKWVWLGTMGWMNTEGDPQEPLPEGTPTFGNFGDGSIVGPAGSEVDSGADATSGDADVAAETATEAPAESTQTAAAPQQTISSSQGAFTSASPMGLTYAAPQAPQIVSVAPASKVDYAKALNSALALDVMGNMLTGRKV